MSGKSFLGILSFSVSSNLIRHLNSAITKEKAPCILDFFESCL